MKRLIFRIRYHFAMKALERMFPGSTTGALPF